MATIVLAGGGSAGHVEPALAVAREWMKLHPLDTIVFIGTANGLENRLVPASGFTLAHIPKVTISRKLSLTWLSIPFTLIRAVLSSRVILRDADLLFGFGGYVSAPAYIAARLLAVPTVVHEANAKPGWANRIGASLTNYVAVAGGVTSKKFAHAVITGLPLRSDVALAYSASHKNWPKARQDAKTRLGFSEHKPLLFIMGGSQGSVAINAVVAHALAGLLKLDMSILHSIGSANQLPPPREGYRPVAYVDSMADAYLGSDLVIGRSGAVTCSEFRALGRYALFIPLPLGNGEQFFNANSIVKDGRAQILVQSMFTPDYIQNHIVELLARADKSPMQGSDVDVNAAAKIVALGESAILKK